MINPTDPPTSQQIHCFKPTINWSWPTTHFSHNPTTTQTPDPNHYQRPKHRTQPWPTTPLSTDHSKKKKKNKKKNKKKTQPQNPSDCNPLEKMSHCDVWCWCWEENGVWVWREERADGETEKEKREENWNNEIEEREISGEKVNKIYIFFRILLQYNSNFRIVL